MRVAVRLLCAFALTGSACSGTRSDSQFDRLSVESLGPPLAVPGTTLVVAGSGFVGEPWGTPSIAFSVGERVLRLPAHVVDQGRLEAELSAASLADLGGNGELAGEYWVEIVSGVNGATYASNKISVSLSLRDKLVPLLEPPATDTEAFFVGDKLPLRGSGFLLGGREGRTFLHVEGCFRTDGRGGCDAVTPTDLPLRGVETTRGGGHALLSPELLGIHPGEFIGTAALVNEHANGAREVTGVVPLALTVEGALIFEVNPGGVSLGQHLYLHGAGFVPRSPRGATLLELSNAVLQRQNGRVVEIGTVYIVPDVLEGRVARYTINEEHGLGQRFKVRRGNATLRARLTPVIQFDGEEVRGRPREVSLDINPVKQVVHVVFRDSYVASLRAFGLRAVDREIRERVVQVIHRDYETINLEVRQEQPEDFALYSELQVSGPDPNDVGLLGYDNTPGKDSGNWRLFDRIGGVNAETQRDGFPGYGGVFIESMFVFSENPGRFADRNANADPAFDKIFDPFRPDRGGQPISSEDLRSRGELVVTGVGCPAVERSAQIGCAIWVLGNLIGTTASHEIGHSIGLANPDGSGFHNSGDEPNRLMDAGGDRPFAERAELFGKGPARLCDDEYHYLRDLMSGPEPEDLSPRPPCFATPKRVRTKP